ncbi:MAG: hypothetical protein GY809_28265 [Planctomycetes bacterium]|nr:hypothetical protein [Planctomycetota bacterium]
MIWPLIKLDLRKALTAYLVLLVAQIGFVLITRDVLDSANITIAVLALAQGWMLAYLIFRDTHNTRAFVFSRPWSRARIFWTRWGLAMVLQTFTVLLVYTILAAGTRTWLYRTELPYFPMVERFELSILWPMALASVITFHAVMFLTLWGYLGYNPGSRRPWHGIVVKIAIAFILMTFIGAGRAVTTTATEGPAISMGDLAIIYAIAVAVMCTAASLNCHKHMEIES